MLVREDDMRRLRRDLPVEVKLSSLRRQEFKAQVVDIAPAEEERIENIGLTVADEGSVPVERESAEPAPLIQVYLVEAEPRQQFTGMRWGMTGKARIVYDRGPVGSYYLGKLIHKLYKKWHRVR